MMNSVIKPTIIIGIVTFISAFVLSQVMSITRPNIEKLALEKEESALMAVLPGYTVGKKNEKQVNAELLTWWEGTKKTDSGEKSGYAFITTKPGYSGDLRTMVGIDDQGKILGISVLQQTETPGLGARVIEVASSVTFFGMLAGNKDDDGPKTPWFAQMFEGIDTLEKIEVVTQGDWDLAMRDQLLSRNSVSAITGSTITTRAIAESINEGVERLKTVVTIPAPPKENEPEDITAERTGGTQ